MYLISIQFTNKNEYVGDNNGVWIKAEFRKASAMLFWGDFKITLKIFDLAE